MSVALSDGTVFNATALFSWAFWRGLRLTEVTANGPHGEVEAAGEMRIPRHAVNYVQVIGR
ncbi:hypothetical protein I2485_06795 [Nesterenkonia sp. E16_7]|uniref:hypothetical protein n=1 Tax=unclassified Nesterenkonia TaxID=2629769 RepID=UPI001A929280|nr:MULTISPECIES: hypothetical protein [unclassified Nesterenkonia]MBO0596582.1 hypothetical protein [Nesterenkonia sp. E16_10]MBO0598359.1 hypothetical protein [Nesterenkonia sp. E16_7]